MSDFTKITPDVVGAELTLARSAFFARDRPPGDPEGCLVIGMCEAPESRPLVVIMDLERAESVLASLQAHVEQMRKDRDGARDAQEG